MKNKKKSKEKSRSGDLLLDRYLPNVSEEKREEARRIFSAYAVHLLKIGERVLREDPDAYEMLEAQKASGETHVHIDNNGRITFHKDGECGKRRRRLKPLHEHEK